MRILITGGMGYVGTRVLDLLSGYDDLIITVVDNLLSGPLLNYNNISFVDADIRDNLDFILNGQDVIIHLAAIVGEPACSIDPEFAWDVNVKGTARLLSGINHTQKFIFASSSSVYGRELRGKVDESIIPQPINKYGNHKLICEDMVTHAAKDYVIFRPATAFGYSRRMRMDLLVNSLIYEALTEQTIRVYEPHIIRPMVHVDDYAKAIINAIYGIIPRGIYNLGDPSLTVTKIGLVYDIAKLTGSAITLTKRESNDPRNYDLSFARLLDTGFMFTHDPLSVAISQIAQNLNSIKEHYEEMLAPKQVERYLKESK